MAYGYKKQGGYTRRARRQISGTAKGAVARKVWICQKCNFSHTRKPGWDCGFLGCNGREFKFYDSKAEATRGAELEMLQRAFKVSNLIKQPRFDLHAINAKSLKPVKIGFAKLDFQYDLPDGTTVYEDYKGAVDTALSAWKRKHIEAEYNIKVTLTGG